MMNDFLKKVFGGCIDQPWILALLTVILSSAAILVFRKLVLIKLKKWSAQTTNTTDDFIIGIFESSIVPLLYVSAVYFSLKLLALSETLDRVSHVCFLLLVTIFVARMLTGLIRHLVYSFTRKQEDSEVKQKQAKGLLIIFNGIIWSISILFLLDNLGYDVTTLVAGLGIGGIAIALAAQTILGDLFSYFVIFFDRPFEIGDFIIVEDKMGTVEYIGIKTTRVRTLSGEQLICSNTYLTNARVHNYKRMYERRVVFKLGVVYQTGYNALKDIPKVVRVIIESENEVRFDRGHFSHFGDFSLDFEFVYYVLSSDYNVYMDIQQRIYLQIVKVFEKQGIEFAYPTQSVLINPANKNAA